MLTLLLLEHRHSPRCTTMFASTVALLVLTLCRGDPDTFNYVGTNRVEDTYGPAEWGDVKCDDTKTCVRYCSPSAWVHEADWKCTHDDNHAIFCIRQPGWPTNWNDISDFIPYEADMANRCLDCSESVEGACAVQVQSPINLAVVNKCRGTCERGNVARDI